MQLLLLFLSTIGISYAASLQPGPLNMLVFKTSLEKGKPQAVRVALGGILPEFIYCLACVFIIQSEWFSQHILWMRISVPVLFFIMARNAFISKENNNHKTFHIPEFWKGLLTGLSNPLLPLFWFGLITALSGFFMYENFGALHSVIIATGAAIGAFILQLHYIKLAGKLKLIFTRKGKNLNKFTAYILLICGIGETARIIYLLLNHGS